MQVLNSAMERFPAEHELRYWRGNALRIDGDHANAESDFRAVLLEAPDHRNAAFSLAHMLREDGRLLAAAEVVMASLRARTNDQAHAVAALAFLRECGAHSQACATAALARERWPGNAEVAAFEAEFALANGDFGEAQAALRAALDIRPRDGLSMLRLAYCQRFSTHDNQDMQRIERTWQDPALDHDERIQAGFALGKALDDLDEFEAATTVLRPANDAAARRAAWSAADWQAFVDRQLAGEAIPRANGLRAHVPVFVVGLPRTGTTLAASLLARDGQVRNRGELNWIDGMYRVLVANGRLQDRAALASAAKTIDAHLRRDDSPSHWYLDKNPLNFRYLEFIAALYPNAKIINCRRAPRDTALSLWRQHFAHPDLGFSYDFSSISSYMKGYEAILAHQQDVLPLDFFDLDYEALVQEPAESLERLRSFVGLHGKEHMVHDRESQVVTTASVWQVRQPVYTTSIGRWIPYAEYLPELTTMF